MHRTDRSLSILTACTSKRGLPIRRAELLAMLLLVFLLTAAVYGSAEVPWVAIPPAQWQGSLDVQVSGLKHNATAVIALPARDAVPLNVTSAQPQPAGVYEVRLTLRASHVAGIVAFHSGLRLKAHGVPAADFPGQYFARAQQPEPRIAQIVQPEDGPLRLRLEAYTDVEVVKPVLATAQVKNAPDIDGGDAEGGDDAGLNPKTAVYYLVDSVEFRPLSHSGQVTKVSVDKIRYLPGDTLKGGVAVADAGGKGGTGVINLYFEHGLKDRTKVKSLPVTLKPALQELPFELPVPKEELGYALVAEYVSADGTDHSEAAEFFAVAVNFQRVAIFGGGLSTRDAILEEETIRRDLTKARAEYFNATEYFAWAEDDMVAMSPKTDFWSSGQTNYRMHKQTIQRQIRLAHEQGLAVATYGKFIMSGLPGWETAYDYPNDHRAQYSYPVGMWEGVNVQQLDRRRDQDFRVYSKGPNVQGNALNTWWSTFMPINPDATPRMARIAAEECVRSIDMFGWDAIRWDGHPRGAGWAQCGSSGNYMAWAARKTQSLVRYFKEIVAAKYPNFAHGYNYLLIQPDKKYDWALEDYELDELCRGGGLLMNESIGNASAGWTFAEIAHNLQVEGDLCRERGGYYLGISFAMTPRDMLIESALWAAAGCRPYNAAMTREIRRYCTRYSQYTFDERLRRLAMPEKVLTPQTATSLWWQPFVYETPPADGKRQLVVNLLNIPQQVKRPNNRDTTKPRPEWEMLPGTNPVTFALTLPAGIHATGANLIDPQTLAVTPLSLKDNHFEVPSVAAWQVAVIDLAVAAGVPALASLYGPSKTFGVSRTGIKEEERKAEVVLDPTVEIWEVNKRIGELAPEWEVKRDKEQAALDALSGEARNQALLARRQPPEELLKTWWKGAAIPADLALKDKRPDFGDLTPRRNGRFDIFYGRGAMDYRLKLPLAIARLDRFQIHDAWLWGAVKQTPNMGLANNVPGQRYADFDLLLFTGIPHCAIGVENSYAMVDYVKAGGAAFFTGGEYAFGKGGYMHTVLERDLLPLQCTGMQDTVYADLPLPFEPGPDLADLNVKLDFTAKPVFWVRNEVVLKPGAKVFLKSGDRPILVGWQLGKGRVACLLVDYRGKSEKKVTAFFDWQEWPRLMEAVMRWLAPAAGRTDPPAATREVKGILAQLEAVSGDVAGDDDSDGPGAAPSHAAKSNDKALKQRVTLIDQALAASGPTVAAALAQQLASGGALPWQTRTRILSALQAARPAIAATLGHDALQQNSGLTQSCGYLLLALVGAPEFSKALMEPLPALMEAKDTTSLRRGDLVLGVALYPQPDLVDEGRRRVAAMNGKEAATHAEFAKVCAGDLPMLETSPYLDADTLLARLAWLAYLSRYDAKTFGTPFLREWLRCAQYQDYCERAFSNFAPLRKVKGAAVNETWNDLISRFGALQTLTRPDVDSLLTTAPAEVAAALTQVRFSSEVRAAINLLGNLERNKSTRILQAIGKNALPDLTTFTTARLGGE